VVKHVGAVELRVVFAAVLAAAADAVLVAQNLLELGAHLVTARARPHVRNLARRSSLEAETTREKKSRGGAEKRKKLRVVVWHEKQGNAGGARARIPNGKLSCFSNLSTFWHHAKHAGYGRARSRNICFGYVLVAVRQGQRRNAAAAGKEKPVRCAAG
jgi:hypothetical protein